jgi:hypothetical protein
MTPKEKAEDIIDSFVRDGYDIVLDEKQAKRCALIAVNEILVACGLETEGKFEFYFEVKQEIEKL